MHWLKDYGTTLGPLDVPMTDEQAFALDALLKDVPGGAPAVERRAALPAHLLELADGERADVSWISTEAPDRMKEVVLASGMDDSHFKMNPVVTLNHSYWSPPVGRSLWRKRVTDPRRGIVAKTHYPARPEAWADPSWLPDEVLALVQSGLCVGKSIGFITLDSSPPTEDEVRRHPEWAAVRRVVRRWLLLEYACCYFPAQQEAVLQGVSKATRKALGMEADPPAPAPEPAPPVVPGRAIPLAEIEASIRRRIDEMDLDALIREIWKSGYDGARGRV